MYLTILFIKFTIRNSAHNSNLGGNAFEALIGAIYLDRGYAYCKYFMENRIIGQYIDLKKISRKEVNFKSKLIEWSQKNKILLRYELVSQSLDEFNSPIFETEVFLEGISVSKGKGYSKKESQQNAAHESMNKIKKDSAFVESLFAAKALREGEVAEKEGSESNQDQTPITEKKVEAYSHTDRLEDIISAAEEAAYSEIE